MNVLVIGTGAREHALAWKIRQSPRVDRLFVASGNAGTAAIAQNLPIAPTDLEKLARAVRDHRVDLTVVGPEAPLADGIVDYFQDLELPVFGPTKAAAQIECSKAFAKDLMLRHGIPTGDARVFSSYPEAKEYVEKQPPPLVVKADGLASGKGVRLASTKEEALQALYDIMYVRIFGSAGDKVLIEEYLEGQEVSVFAFTDGENVSSIVAACDYKRALDNGEGPNTGGMGSYSPPGFWTAELSEEIRHQIIEPTVQAMAQEGIPYQGTLYAGLMLTKDGLKVLEFNCRLGDPENQVIMPRLKSDLVEVMLSVIDGSLKERSLEWADDASVGVVLASGGYPREHQLGLPIEGLDKMDPDIVVFHAGTRIIRNGGTGRASIVTDGGRVLTVVAIAPTLDMARSKVYDNVRRIGFKNAHYRRDIAAHIKRQT